VITMTATAPAGLPFSRALTRADLDDTPDDGHRYELIDGALLVTPAPAPRHQFGSAALHLLLAAACPAELRVLLAPLDVVLADDTVVQPDLLVARRTDFTERDLPVAPLLAVEILSPSTRRIDLMLKRSRYEAAGCRSYWVVDPDVPSIIAWELRDGVYELVGEVSGDDSLSLEQPYPVTVVPARLFD
jgi:Uma2 family endonuclease